jgi:hypothetical protein
VEGHDARTTNNTAWWLLRIVMPFDQRRAFPCPLSPRNFQA